MKKLPIAEIVLVVLGAILYFMANLQRVAVPGAFFGVLQQDLQTSAQCITALGAIFMYIYALGQLVIGVLIARYGGFRVVTVGALLFFTGSLMFPFSHALSLLYISRFLIGLGSATFYLGMINETRRLVSKKNFGVILSLILFVGYLGGIVANAPLVICIRQIGWREIFVLTGIITAVLALLFIIIDRTVKHVKVDKTVHMDLALFRETFKNRKNLDIYSFACINYGLYYVIQTVIGKKFLEDFCLMPEIKAAAILSVMGALYAVAGSILAFASKAILNRRTIFLKISAANTLLVFGLILLFVCLDIKTGFIGFMFCTIAFGASLSPLLVSMLHDFNQPKVANTAVSVMTCGFFIVVAVLSNIIGWCLDEFIPYSHNSAYSAIFGLAFVLAIYSFVNVFKIKESEKTMRYIEHVHYLKEHEQEPEHHLYNNI